MGKKEHPFARNAATYCQLASQVATVSFDAADAQRLQRIEALAERCKSTLGLTPVTLEGSDLRPPAPHRAERPGTDGPGLPEA